MHRVNCATALHFAGLGYPVNCVNNTTQLPVTIKVINKKKATFFLFSKLLYKIHYS